RRSGPRRRRAGRASPRAAAPRRRRARRTPAPGSAGPRGPSARRLRAERGRDRVDRLLLGLAHLLAVLLVGGGDPLRQAEHEALVRRAVLRRPLRLDRPRRLAQPCDPVALQRLGRAVLVPVDLRLLRDDLVQQLALSVLLAGLRVGLGERKALAEAPAAL